MNFDKRVSDCHFKYIEVDYDVFENIVLNRIDVSYSNRFVHFKNENF